MLALLGDRHAGLAAALADDQDLAAVLAVGLADDHRLPDVAAGVDVVALLNEAAQRAEPAVIAQRGAGGWNRVDEDEVVDVACAVELSAMGAVAAVAAVAVRVAAAGELRQGVVPQPDIGDAVLLHAHALVGVGHGVINGVLSLLGVAGRGGHRAGVGAVAVADDCVDAGLGEVGHGDRVGLPVHDAVVVGNHGLRRDELVVGVVALFAVRHDGKPLLVDLRQHIGMQGMPLQRLLVGVPCAVAELAVGAAVHGLGVIGGVGVGVSDDIIQLLGELGGAVVEPVHVLAEAVIRRAHVAVHGAAGGAAGFRPVIAGIGGIHAGGAVQDNAGAFTAIKRAIRITYVAGHRGLTVAGVLRGAPDAKARVQVTARTVEGFIGHGGIDIQLVGAVHGVHPAFRRVMVAVLLTGESRGREQSQRHQDREEQRQDAASVIIFRMHFITSVVIDLKMIQA